MQEPIITNLPNSQVELKFVVTADEAQPYIEQASTDLQTQKPIQGFRPGKAPHAVVKQTFGEMHIWETALEKIVRSRYVHTILEKSIETIGSPAIAVDKIVPGQDIKFTVTASIMPAVLTVESYDKPLVTKKIREVGSSEVDAAFEDLRKMRRQEAAVDRIATKEDLVIVNLDIKKDGVSVDGGTALNHKVYLHEPHYIPGFAEQLLGLKKGDTKSFTLTFPKEHYQKHLAGQPVEFTITVNDVFELKLPELNDEFTKVLGVESVEKLREILTDNLKKEAEQKADEASEIELLETLIKGSKFSDIPEILINEEVRRMFSELQHAAEHQGMNMADYLSNLKKSADQLKMDMIPRAIERVKTAVLVKEIAKREQVSVSDEEIDAEVDRILQAVEDKDTKERVSSPDYRDYVAAQMRNRKTLEALKTKAIKTE
jgi:trigger factor